MRSLNGLRARRSRLRPAQRADRHHRASRAALRHTRAAQPVLRSGARAVSGRFRAWNRRRGSTRCRCRAARRSTWRPEGAPPVQASELPVVAVRLASPGYFGTARIPILKGRDFTEADTIGRPGVVIVSERTAQRFWPNQDPLGKHVTLSMMSPEPREVVGVVRRGEDRIARRWRVGLRDRRLRPARAIQLRRHVARSSGRRVPPDRVARPVVGVVRAPRSGAAGRSTSSRCRAWWRSRSASGRSRCCSSRRSPSSPWCWPRSASTASWPTPCGQRVREIGIRMALGAPSTGVLRLVVLDGLKPTLAGVAARPRAGCGPGPGAWRRCSSASARTTRARSSP